VTRLGQDGDGVVLETETGRVRARRVLLATNAYRPLIRAIRRYVVPVYDYVLVTEPLSEEQRRAIGWERRQGVSDSGNRFHYYRLTPDGSRILWGGYEAIYHFRNGMRPELEDHAPTFELLASNFAATFPQLEGIRFTHRWAGAIDTCSRFCVMFGTALGGRVAYAVGYTGLGVVASRFGARAALDLLYDRDTELTRLEMVRGRPIPFPPEPLRYGAIQLTRRALARADERGGRRGPWLRALDRIGAGFDS
jgi:glycine/D-amino acid oxidase-like deaminating enzyme